jgi:hypothetical protein
MSTITIPYNQDRPEILYEEAVPDDYREYSIDIVARGLKYNAIQPIYSKINVKVTLKDIDDNETVENVAEDYQVSDTSWSTNSFSYTPPDSNYYISSFSVQPVNLSVSIQEIRIYRRFKLIYESNYSDSYEDLNDWDYVDMWGNNVTRVSYPVTSFSSSTLDAISIDGVTKFGASNNYADLVYKDNEYFESSSYYVRLEIQRNNTLTIGLTYFNQPVIKYNGDVYSTKTFSYSSPGTYQIEVEAISYSRDTNFYNSSYNTVYNGSFIIDKVPQDPLFIENSLYIYNPSNKTIQLEVSGGNSTTPATFSGTGVIGTELTYVGLGEYTIVATKPEDNFYQDISLSYSLSVVGTEDAIFNIIQIDKSSNETSLEIAEVQLWIGGKNVALDATTDSSVIDDDMATIWQMGSPLYIALDACYNLIDIESLVIHVPSGSEVNYSNSRLMLMLNNIGIYEYKNPLTYGSKYRLDGPAITNVSSFASTYDDTTKIPSETDVSNVIVQSILLPYKSTGYAPSELVSFNQTEYKIIFDYKTEVGNEFGPRNLYSTVWFDNNQILYDILLGIDFSYSWQTYNLSFFGPTMLETSNFRVRMNVGINQNDKRPAILGNIRILANNQQILQNGNFDSSLDYWDTSGSVYTLNNAVYIDEAREWIEQSFDISIVNKYDNVVSTDLPYVHEVQTTYQIDISQNNDIEYEAFNSTYFFSRVIQTDFFITNDASYVYLENNNIVLSVSNDTPLSIVTFSGDNVVGNELVNPDTGFYTITATKTNDPTYNDVTDVHIIEIMRANQSDFQITNDISYIYNPIDTIPIDVSGGSGTGGISYTNNGMSFDGSLNAPNVGFYNIVATKDGDLNHYDISDSHILEILKSHQSPFEITNDVSYVYNPINTIPIDVSGGTDITDISFTVNGVSFDGSLNAPNVGFYNIVATKDGSMNYYDISDSHSIEITKSHQSAFEITNDVSYVYNPINTIPIDVSGGTDITDVLFTVNGQAFDGSLNTPNVGIYNVVATKDGSMNYYDISDSHSIEITKSHQSAFEITNDVSYVYNPINTIPIDVSGGTDITDVLFTVNGQAFDGSLNTPNVGIYNVVATKDGSMNYYDISDSHSIEITKSYQSPFEFTNDVSYVYDPNAIIYITVSGGSGDGLVTISGDSVIVDRLEYPIVDSYEISAVKDGSLNYFDISDTHIINITKSVQDPILITPTINYELSGGSQTILVTGGSTNSGINVESTSDTITIINGDTVIYYSPTIVPLHVTKLGDHNYFDIDKDITFEVLLNIPHLKDTLKKTPRELVSDPHISLQIIQPYYSIYELKYNTIEGILDISNNGITLREMKDADFTACQIYNSRLYTLSELMKTGYRINICHR